MAGNGKPPVLVVVQLSGGNDFMNTLIPYNSPIYWDCRPVVNVPQETIIPLNDELGFHPKTAPLKEMFDEGNVAVIQGIGYPNSNRSHFRAMDIWHTCEPDTVSTKGWLGQAIRDLDPDSENVLTGVNLGRGLPRAMTAPGVPVASVGDLDTYGVMTSITDNREREEALDVFKRMYGPAFGTGMVMDYLAQTGGDVLKGADRLAEAPVKYSSDVEYAGNAFAKSLKDAARIHLADLGTRILYVAHGGYDTHAAENPTQPRLLDELSTGIADFFDDLRAHDAAEEVVMFVFTEFGRRMKDNGSGTDHGTGGGAFIIGDRVKGGLYSEYPLLDPAQWEHGEDLKHTIDFRGIYGTLLDQWMGLDAPSIVRGHFEQIDVFA